MKSLKKEALIFFVVSIFIGTVAFSVFKEDVKLLAGIFIAVFSLAGVFIAYFFPKTFCFLIIISAPLSINTSDLINESNLALSLPTEGLLGILLLFSSIKAIGGLHLNKKILTHPISLVLFGSIIWMTITALTSSIPDTSIKRVILKSSFILGFYFVFTHLFLEQKNRKMLFILYGAGLIIPIINAFYTHAQFGFSQEDSFEMTEPFYEDHTLYGACIAFIIPFFTLYAFNKFKTSFFSLNTLLTAGLLVLLVIAELLSYSRAAWISIIGAFAIYFLTFIKIPPKWYLLVISTVILVVSLNFSNIYDQIKSNDAKKNNDNVEQHLETVTDLKSNASNLERINRWVCAYRMFAEKPVLGWGPGTYQFQYAKFQTDEFTTEISSNNGDRGNAHSEYLTYLAEEGIIGLFLFIMLIILSISKSLNMLYTIKNNKEKLLLYGFFLGLITFYLHGFFNAFSDYEKMSILVYSSLAGIVATEIKIRSDLGN